jgi:hypothetical protein
MCLEDLGACDEQAVWQVEPEKLLPTPPLSARAVVCCAQAEARFSASSGTLGCGRTRWAVVGLNLNPKVARHSQPRVGCLRGLRRDPKAESF